MYLKTITIIILVNICQHSYKKCFLLMRIFKIYSLRSFHICDTILLTIVTMLLAHYITLTLLYH